MFFARKKELDILHEELNSNKKKFILLYGHRRVGKRNQLNKQ
jgi:AAA+ ATPase superfamily predicted ATPase